MGNAAFVIGGGNDDGSGAEHHHEETMGHEDHALLESENQHYHTPQASPQRITRHPSSGAAYNNMHAISLNPTSPQSSTPARDNNNSWQRFPLHHAAACGAPITELSRIIELSGTDVDDIHDESGSTPLHYAAMYGQETTVRWFLKQRRMLGRNQPVRDFQGRTAADMAKHSGFADLAQVIEFHHQSNSNSSLTSSTAIRPAQHHNDNILLQELDRANSTIAKLKASEKRVRMELEQEIAERMKLFRSLVKSHDNNNAAFIQQPAADLVETMSDMRLQIVEFKAQRDALAAELKLVELAVADFELYITGNTSSDSINSNVASTTTTASPSERLKSCLRRI